MKWLGDGMELDQGIIQSLLDDGWVWIQGRASLRKEFTCVVQSRPNTYRLDIFNEGFSVERYDTNNVATMSYKERIYIPTGTIEEAITLANAIIAGRGN